MCNGFWWIVILWFLFSNNGCGGGCGCGEETNNCGGNWGYQRNTRSCGCAQERENDCDCGCDNVRVVRGCCN